MKPAACPILTWRRVTAAALLACVLVGYFQRTAILTGMGRWLNVGQKLESPVDAVMVLGGGVLTRPFVAVEMVRAGFAGKVLIPQVELSDDSRDGLTASEQQIMWEIMQQSGITAENIVLLDSVVDSTEREAQVAADYLKAHPAERLAVVTNDFHTRRARWLFTRICGSDADRLVMIGAPADDYRASNWWHFETGIISYVNEYLKLGLTLVRQAPVPRARP